MRLRFLSVAAQELAEARENYDAISPELARRFLVDIGAALSRVRANPTAWARLGENHRRCRTSHFPYGLISAAQEDEVLILAAAGGADPQGAMDRDGSRGGGPGAGAPLERRIGLDVASQGGQGSALEPFARVRFAAPLSRKESFQECI